MIICSCAIVTDQDLELALRELLSRPDAPLPTPGVVYRHLAKTMKCCGCAPLAVDTIYQIVERLEQRGEICPCACAKVRAEFTRRDARRERDSADPLPEMLVAAE